MTEVEVDIDVMMETICEDVAMLPIQKKEHIAKIFKNRIPNDMINRFCFESADGTRIDLDRLADLDNFKTILREIYNLIKSELSH